MHDSAGGNGEMRGRSARRIATTEGTAEGGRVALLTGNILRENWFPAHCRQMDLPESTLTLLRDEAYALLVQEALGAEIGKLERERADRVTKRPKFGMLSGRKSKEAYEDALRAVEDSAGPLRVKWAQITGIAERLHPVVRQEVSSYLASESPDYCRVLQIRARLDDWERAFQHLPEVLLAFARDMRELRQAVEKETTPGACAHEIAVLRESAERLGRAEFELSIIVQAALSQAPAGIAEQIRFPALPDLKRVPWVGRLAVLPAAMMVAEVTRAEGEFRAFLAGPAKTVGGQLQQGRAVCAQLANQMLDDYWNVLRTHARTHYVEEMGLDDVIDILNARYVDSDIQRKQEEITAAPFVWR